MKSTEDTLAYCQDGSSIVIAPYSPEHMLKIKPQDDQKDFMSIVPENFEHIANVEGFAKTIFDRDGEIISVCGIFPRGDQGFSWAIHSNLFKKHALAVTRAIKNLFKGYEDTGNFHRFLGTVASDFTAGHRWMRMIGFEKNNQSISIAGSNFDLYERVV